jgi:TetR/AcrR family transcriptional regulator, cholesterol catabolism regulator
MPKPTRMGQRRMVNSDASSAFYRERRKAIVDAAAATFQERGYGATTIAAIAEKLNTDRATLYYYFGSKQELFRQVVREVAKDAVEAAEAIASKAMPAGEKLREAFQSVLETYSSSYPYMHVFLQENFPVVHAPEDDWNTEARDWAKRYYLAIRRIIQQGVDEGSFHLTLPLGVTTMGVLGTVNWAHRWYRPGRALSPKGIGDGFSRMLLMGLTSPDKVRAATVGKNKRE